MDVIYLQINFNKNYLSSIIARYNFYIYHIPHGSFNFTHIGLSMIVWLPIFVLFLFKLLEKQSKYYSIVGGIIFFLVSLTHLYYFVFIVTMFSIVFFAVYIFRQKKVSNKTFITNFSILLAIGLISTSVLFLSNRLSQVMNYLLDQLVTHSQLVWKTLYFLCPVHTTQIHFR